MGPLKTITYRGGIARFDIPVGWREDYEPSGGATFGADDPDSGILRLNVLSFSSNGKETGEQTVAGLVTNSGYQTLDGGLAMRQYIKNANQEGEALQLFFWEVAVPVAGGNVRLAIFSYTILDSQAGDERVLAEIEMIGRSIRAAEFSRESGVAGDYRPESPQLSTTTQGPPPKGVFGFLRRRNH